MPSYNRARRFGSSGGGGIDLAALFGALGGGDVSLEGANEGELASGDKQVIRAKPKHPVLNVLSGGRGSQAAQEFNLGQTGEELASQRRVGEAKQLGDYEMGQLPRRLAYGRINARGIKEDTSEIEQNQLQREMYIKDSGKFPEDDLEQFANWQKSQYELTGAQKGEQTARANLGKTLAIHGQETENVKHPFSLQSTRNRGAADIYKSAGEEYEAEKNLGILPFKKNLEQKEAEADLADSDLMRTLGQSRASTAVSPYGSFNYLTGEHKTFPNFQQQLIAPLLEGAGMKVNAPKLSPVGTTNGGEKVYDPVTGMNAVRKPQVQSAPSVSPNPFGQRVEQAPSSPFANVPVSPIGTSKPMFVNYARQELLQKLNAMREARPEMSGMPSFSFEDFSDDELETIYQRLKDRF